MTATIPSYTGVATSPDEKPSLGLKRHFTTPGLDPYDAIAWELRSATIADETGKAVFEQTNVEVPAFWSQTATQVVASKYFRGRLDTPERESSATSSSTASSPSWALGGESPPSPKSPSPRTPTTRPRRSETWVGSFSWQPAPGRSGAARSYRERAALARGGMTGDRCRGAEIAGVTRGLAWRLASCSGERLKRGATRRAWR